MSARNLFTVETVPHCSKPERRHFAQFGPALLAFHVQRNTGQHSQVLLWDNRAGEVVRQFQEGRS